MLLSAADAGLAALRAGELVEAVVGPGPALPPLRHHYDIRQQAAARGPGPAGGSLSVLAGASLLRPGVQGDVGAAIFDPDLTPVQPSGWSGPIVTSRVTGTNTHTSSISTTDTVFVDLAVGNIGFSTSDPALLAVFLDGAFEFDLTIPALAAGEAAAALDLNFGQLGAGSHTIEILIDPDDFVFEGDEFNNYAARTFSVTGGPAPQPDLAGFQPPGWGGSIVASKVMGTNTDAASFLPTDPVFIDFALNNVGGTPAGAFQLQLLVDNVVVDTFGSPGLEPFSVQGQFQGIQDYQLAPLANGQHTISVKLDSGNAVTEANEANNLYSKQVTVGPAAPGSIAGTVFNDADGDGTRDAGEGALGGWQVYIDADNDGALDAGETVVNSNAQGAYTLGNLQPGNYTVRQVVQPGFEQTFPSATASNFNIEVVFPDGSLSASQRAVFTTAANRWMQVIVGDVPDVLFEGGTIDDVRILATGPAIDGPGGTLGQAGPTDARGGTLIPFLGVMEFDSADLADLEADGQLLDVILHEMGHVLGIGSLWGAGLKNLISGSGTADPRYTGPRATAEFNAVFGTSGANMPAEDQGVMGATRESHWRESVMDAELLTGFSEAPGVPMPLSRITVGGLEDLGYQVNYAAADSYTAPGVGAAGGGGGGAANFDPFNGGYFTRPELRVGGTLVSAGGAGGAGGAVGPAAGEPGHQVTVAAGQNVTGKDFGSRQVATNQPPAIAGLTDSPDPVTLGGTVTLTAAGVTDPNGNNTVTAVAFYRESNGTAGLQVGTGGDTQVGNDTNGADEWSAAVNTAGLTAGTTYTYYARATDNAGATSDAASTTNTVQPPVTNQPPAIASVTANPNPAPPDTSTLITANGVTDPDGNNTVASVRFYQESNETAGLQPGAGGDILFHTDTNGADGWSVNLDLAGVPAGTYPIYALATDNQGATSPTGPAAAKVDLVVGVINDPPTIASLAANPSAVTPGVPVTLTANGVADSDGFVTGVSFYRETNGTAGLQTGTGGDTLIGTDSNPFAGWTATLATAGLAAGPYTLYAQATDNQGAVSTPAQTAITVGGGVSQTPGAPDLADAGDTGASNSDNLTNLDNSAAAKVLTFNVGGTVPGSLVELLAGTQVIGSATATGTTTPVTTNGSFDLADGAHQITARQTEPGKQVSAASAALAVMIDTVAPAVSGALVLGSAWSPQFLNFLRDRGLGDGGFAVPAGAAQANVLPWTNLDRVRLRFTETVAGLLASHLQVAGVTAYTPTGFDPVTLTWSVPTLGTDRLRLSLSPLPADAAGNLLDGEWAGGGLGPDTFPSGDGTPGGDFAFRFNVVPGDVDRNGAVNIFDTLAVRNRQGTSTTSAGTAPNTYSAFHDVDGNAAINIFDTLAARNRQGTSLPAPGTASRFSAWRIGRGGEDADAALLFDGSTTKAAAV